MFTLRKPVYVSEYDQEMPQLQTADLPTASRGRDTKHRQPQHNVSKATSSLFLIQMIAKMIAKQGIVRERVTEHRQPLKN